MRYAAFTLTLIQYGLSELACAQAGDDPASQLAACSRQDRTERLECRDPLAQRTVQQPASNATRTDHWIVSETTSPVNYSPLIIATTSSRSDSERVPSLLSISCRNGRTELAVTNSGSSAPRRSADHVMVAHQVDDQPPVRQRWSASTPGKGAAFAGDVVGFLKSLPDHGEISVRVFDGRAISHDGRFLLDGVSIVREKVAAACKWPDGSGAPRQSRQ
jgi:hypothetical protein